MSTTLEQLNAELLIRIARAEATLRSGCEAKDPCPMACQNCYVWEARQLLLLDAADKPLEVSP